MNRRHHLEDAATEAFFAGNGAGDEDAPLEAFAAEVRSMGAGPVPAPSAQLAVVLARGLSTARDDLPATAARNETGPAQQGAEAPGRRRRRVLVGEFIAGLSVAAKATFGISMAAASVTAAGAVGVLPGPAQHAVAAAVEAATPFTFPDEAGDEGGFGERVSTDGRDGGVDGQEISEEAKQNGEAHRPAGAGEGQKPAEPGQTGLDQAAETPAADHAPPSVPGGHSTNEVPAPAAVDERPAPAATPPTDPGTSPPTATPAGDRNPPSPPNSRP